jgi:hypothetical protein
MIKWGSIMILIWGNIGGIMTKKDRIGGFIYIPQYIHTSGMVSDSINAFE